MTNTFLALPLGFWQGMVRHLNVQKALLWVSSFLVILEPWFCGFSISKVGLGNQCFLEDEWKAGKQTRGEQKGQGIIFAFSV